MKMNKKEQEQNKNQLIYVSSAFEEYVKMQRNYRRHPFKYIKHIEEFFGMKL